MVGMNARYHRGVCASLYLLILTVMCAPRPGLGFGKAPEPYPKLNGATSSRPAVPTSPDPLQRLTWPGTGVNTSQLQIYSAAAVAVQAVPAAAFANASTATHGEGLPGQAAIAVRGAGVLRLDFGVERAAWLEFDSPDLPQELLDSGALMMSISEYSEPAVVNSGAQQPNKTLVPTVYPGNASQPGDYVTYRLETNDELYEGVRFGWIHVMQAPSDGRVWHITGVRVVCQTKPVGYSGSFSSSLQGLEEVWWTAAYTLRLNLMGDYFGSILMERSDRHSWTGDAHLEQKAAMIAFSADDAFVLQNINRTACPTCSNNIESYALYWVLSLRDYFWETGDTVGLAAFASTALDKLQHAIDIYGTNPSLHFYGGDERLGSYFEDPNCAENQNAYRMLTIHAMLEFNRTLAAAGDTINATVVGAVAGLAKQAIEFVAKQRAVGPQWWSSFGIHAAADAILAGFATPAEVRAMIAAKWTDAHQQVSFTPFNQFFLVEALFAGNATQLAIDGINGCWGSMLKLGATTFWETFSPQWLGVMEPAPGPPPNGQNGYTSLCHPWAAGAAYLLSSHVLGISPTSPGYRTWKVHPQGLGVVEGLAHVSGVHPNGLSVDLNMTSGTFTVAGAPHGSVGSIGVPRTRFSDRLHSVVLDGKQLWTAASGARRSSAESLGVRVTEDHHGLLCVDGMRCDAGAGACTLVAEYLPDARTDAAQPQRPQVSAPVPYAARFLGRDNVTQGKWRGRYGSKGYVLFALPSNDTMEVSLPPAVESVVAHRMLTGAKGAIRAQTWDAEIAGAAALEPPAANGTYPPGVGVVESSNPAACTQTLKVDVTFAENASQPLRISVFAADIGAMDREMVIEIFDLDTLETVQAWQRVDNYVNGTFLTWEYDKSIRFRSSYIRAIEGVDTGISAVFFD